MGLLNCFRRRGYMPTTPRSSTQRAAGESKSSEPGETKKVKQEQEEEEEEDLQLGLLPLKVTSRDWYGVDDEFRKVAGHEHFSTKRSREL
ncbi:hypothetical protein BASA81_010239 [Batrachochytrium salamandrivorans]|nr:hypothetical protein BASA81_010239 [Batrachochytrium salamandrivorans]